MSGEERVGQRKQTGRMDIAETIVKYEYMKIIIQISIWIYVPIKSMRSLQFTAIDAAYPAL